MEKVAHSSFVEERSNSTDRKPVVPGKRSRVERRYSARSTHRNRVAIRLPKAVGFVVVGAAVDGAPEPRRLRAAVKRRASELAETARQGITIAANGPVLELDSIQAPFEFELTSSDALASFGSLIGKQPSEELTAVRAKATWSESQHSRPFQIGFELVMAASDVPELYARLTPNRENRNKATPVGETEKTASVEAPDADTKNSASSKDAASSDESAEAVVRRYRGEGKADDPGAVGHLHGLLYPKGTAQKVAEVESLIRTGKVEEKLNRRLWAERLDRLAADAKRGYQKALEQLAGPPLAEIIKRLGKLGDVSAEIETSRQIVSAYRLAGKPTNQNAIEQLVLLLKKAGGTVAAIAIVEVWLSESVGAQQYAVTEDIPVAALAMRPDYAAALKRMGLVATRAPKRTSPQPRVDGQKPVVPTIKPIAGIGMAAGSSTFLIKRKDIPTELAGTKNQMLGALLLAAYPDVPQELAWWLATFNGATRDRSIF